jgi:hypothetical protein
MIATPSVPGAESGKLRRHVIAGFGSSDFELGRNFPIDGPAKYTLPRVRRPGMG